MPLKYPYQKKKYPYEAQKGKRTTNKKEKKHENDDMMKKPITCDFNKLQVHSEISPVRTEGTVEVCEKN